MPTSAVSWTPTRLNRTEDLQGPLRTVVRCSKIDAFSSRECVVGGAIGSEVPNPRIASYKYDLSWRLLAPA